MKYRIEYLSYGYKQFAFSESELEAKIMEDGLKNLKHVFAVELFLISMEIE